MKKVLVVNTKYKSFGGEDANILEEISFLERNYIVNYLEFDNSKQLNIYDMLGFYSYQIGIPINSLKKPLKSLNPILFIFTIHGLWLI